MIDAEDLNPWSFPTAEEYAERLDANGFDVDSTPLFLRPTPLPSEVTELGGHLSPQPYLIGVPHGDRPAVLNEMRERLDPVLRAADSGWVADYVGLRFSAPGAAENHARRTCLAPARLRVPGIWLGRLAVHAYYKVERTGDALPEGALLPVANHPNTLIDPAVIQTITGRRIRFLASPRFSRGTR